MKERTAKKKQFISQNTKRSSGGKFSFEGDSFFARDSKKRLKLGDDVIESSDSDMDGDVFAPEADALSGRNGELDETADERRVRLAKAALEKYGASLRDEAGSDEEGNGDYLHSRLAETLQREQLEEKGKLRRTIASRVQKPGDGDGFGIISKHAKSVTAVALSENDSKVFSASKDGSIICCDVENGGREKYTWPNDEVLKSHGCRDPQGRTVKQSKHVLSLSVSSDGRYLVTGGLDRHVHLWDTRTRQHIQSFPGHRGLVSCLKFREGTPELFSGSFDRTVKIWNAEERLYVNTLFGHQSEILTIDCLRKERLLTSGRDRTLQLWKVPEESRLIFRSSQSSLECGCFVGDDEFISGTDDGSIELWNVIRKKPVHVVRGAHGAAAVKEGDVSAEAAAAAATGWVGAVAVCRSSDLAASGAGDGLVRLWCVESKANRIGHVLDLPLVGFVNSLSIARSANFLVAGVGREPRLGRWARQRSAHNGVALHRLTLMEK